jgi:hypothetical protein
MCLGMFEKECGFVLNGRRILNSLLCCAFCHFSASVFSLCHLDCSLPQSICLFGAAVSPRILWRYSSNPR